MLHWNHDNHETVRWSRTLCAAMENSVYDHDCLRPLWFHIQRVVSTEKETSGRTAAHMIKKKYKILLSLRFIIILWWRIKCCCFFQYASTGLPLKGKWEKRCNMKVIFSLWKTGWTNFSWNDILLQTTLLFQSCFYSVLMPCLTPLSYPYKNIYMWWLCSRSIQCQCIVQW